MQELFNDIQETKRVELSLYFKHFFPIDLGENRLLFSRVTAMIADEVNVNVRMHRFSPSRVKGASGNCVPAAARDSDCVV